MDLPDVFSTGEIKIVNRRTHTPTDRDFYIGRGSVLGNPYSHKPSTRAEFRVRTRRKAITLYVEWIKDKIKREDPQVLEALDSIRSLANSGGVNLVCYCAPYSCHGLVIKELINDWQLVTLSTFSLD